VDAKFCLEASGKTETSTDAWSRTPFFLHSARGQQNRKLHGMMRVEIQWRKLKALRKMQHL
jgi:hypothetical protein